MQAEKMNIKAVLSSFVITTLHLCLVVAEGKRFWHSTVGGETFTSWINVTSSDTLQDLCDPSVQSKAGYFNIDSSTKKNYFYWFFESRQSPSNDPLVLWLTGGNDIVFFQFLFLLKILYNFPFTGPGCSGELALLVENGPCSMKKGDVKPQFNKYGWNAFANLLYVDQVIK
jgi:hypothetical protein